MSGQLYFHPALAPDMEKVGGDLFVAIQETAEDIGGPDLMAHVSDIARPVDVSRGFPRAESVVFLEGLSPGVSATIFERMDQIRELRHAQEFRDARKQQRRANIAAFFNGMAAVNPLMPFRSRKY